MSLPSLFDLCEPRDDVRKGSIRESDFAADLALVLRKQAPPEYQDAKAFFANTHPTEGLKRLLQNVCARLSGKGGEASAIFRLDTQYGGGKTHSLIALSHVADGMKGVENAGEFLSPDLIPKQRVRVAAFDGENADPANGRDMGKGVRAFTPWGELAYSLAGPAGYERVKTSDIDRVAPGAETLRELFGGEPTLILLDELSVYLRKIHDRKEAHQLTPFLTTLFKAVESSPQAVIVFTLAIGKGGIATDAYSEENQYLADKLAEAEAVAARKATLLDPTAEHETARVLRRRLFKRIDDKGALPVVEEYRKLWAQYANELPPLVLEEDRAAELREGYPFHPALMSVLTDKLSTLSNFQRVRGMLRLLTQTVSKLWNEKPAATYAVHLHHLDPGADGTRNEIVTRLKLKDFDPAIRNDVANVQPPALAQQIDVQSYPGLPTYGSFVARTILWHSLAFPETLKGATHEDLRYAVLGPGLDPGFVNDARQRFVGSSAYLDDRPNAPLRFLTEANLTQMIRRQEQQVDREAARAELRDRIREIFKGSTLDLVPFATGPEDVPDDGGDGRPLLVLLSYEGESIRPGEKLAVPALVEKVFRTVGSQGHFRQLQNNLVFLVADANGIDRMRDAMIRRLALEAMRLPEKLSQLAEHQQRKVEEQYQKSSSQIALAVQQGYRHLFYPSRNNRVDGALVDLAHAAFDVPSASDKPGQGQEQVVRALVDSQKLLRPSDHPLAPTYVRDQTPLKKGQITTAALRAEFRRDPRLPILIGDDNFTALIRKGIDEDVYVYKSGELLRGKGDPFAEVKVDENSFVFTTVYAKEKGLWPRKPAAPAPPVPPPGTDGGEAAAPTTGPEKGSGATASLSPTAFRAEAPLREALTQLWDRATAAGVKKLRRVSLRIFDAQDAFKLLSVVGRVQGAEKDAYFDAEYETSAGSSLSLKFEGLPEDAQPVKEFLDAQFRAASEKSLVSRYVLTFADGLALDTDAPAKLTEQLARFASGAAYVEAEAEAVGAGEKK